VSLTERFAALARPIEDRVANPLVERALTSPLHPLLSWHVVLLDYAGRRSGRRYRTPVLYWPDTSGLVLVTPREETVWWTNFRTPYGCRVRLRGTWRDATAVVDDDPAAVRAHVARVARLPRRLTRGRWPPDDALDSLADELALVRVSLD